MTHHLRNIDVFILCGGLGKRLRKITGAFPKPMVKIGSEPFLSFIIKYMSKFGFNRFILGTGYKGQIIQKFFLNNPIASTKIIFSREDARLGTGGAIKLAKNLIKSKVFFVLNGDSFCKFNPKAFLNFHFCKNSLVSIVIKKTSDISDYGNITVDKEGRIISFKEKPANSKKSFINAGVYIFDKKLFSYMPKRKSFSLESEFFPEMIGKRAYGYICDNLFIDIGVPKRYFKMKKYFLRKGEDIC